MTSNAKYNKSGDNDTPDGWKLSYVNDIAKLKKNSFTPNEDSNLPYIGLEHINQETLSLNGIGNASEVISNKYFFKEGDILFGKLRPYFRKVFQPKFDGVCSTDIWVFEPKEGNDPTYLFYFMANKDFVNLAISGSTGTRMPRAKWDQIKKSQWFIPGLDDQKQIASVLSSLDDKIELNRRMNKTLEEIGKALFKHWFVDFEFPNENGEPYKSSGGEMVESELGEIPKGWKAKKISELNLEVTDFVANGSFASLKKNTSILDEPNYGLFLRNTDLKAEFSSGFKYVDKHSYEFLSKTKLFGGEVIISNVGDVGSVYRCPYFDKPMTLGNNQIVIKAGENNLFFYLLFISQIGQGLINSITSGSVQLKFNKTDFRNLQIVWPDTKTLNLFINISDDVFKSIDEYKKQIVSLTQIRDSLLPRLMSGKIRVI